MLKVDTISKCLISNLCHTVPQQNRRYIIFVNPGIFLPSLGAIIIRNVQFLAARIKRVTAPHDITDTICTSRHKQVLLLLFFRSTELADMTTGLFLHKAAASVMLPALMRAVQSIALLRMLMRPLRVTSGGDLLPLRANKLVSIAVRRMLKMPT